ncbi:MAG: RNA polymerase sigma factor [Terracidiphilus sp.]
MWRVVDRLSNRQRTVFTLRYGKEQGLGEIARATGLHESAVKAYLWRAVTRVRAELGGRL